MAKYVAKMKDLVAIAEAEKDDETNNDSDKDPDEGGTDDDK